MSLVSHEGGHYFWFEINYKLARTHGYEVERSKLNPAEMSDPFFFRRLQNRSNSLTRSQLSVYFNELKFYLSENGLSSVMQIPRQGSYFAPGEAYLLFKRPLLEFLGDLEGSMAHYLGVKNYLLERNVLYSLEQRLYSGNGNPLSILVKGLHRRHPEITYKELRYAVSVAAKKFRNELGALFCQSSATYLGSTKQLIPKTTKLFDLIKTSSTAKGSVLARNRIVDASRNTLTYRVFDFRNLEYTIGEYAMTFGKKLPWYRSVRYAAILRGLGTLAIPAVGAWDFYQRVQQQNKAHPDTLGFANNVAAITEMSIDWAMFGCIASRVGFVPMIPVIGLCILADATQHADPVQFRDNRDLFFASMVDTVDSPQALMAVMNAFDKGEEWTRKYNENTVIATKQGLLPFRYLNEFGRDVVDYLRDPLPFVTERRLFAEGFSNGFQRRWFPVNSMFPEDVSFSNQWYYVDASVFEQAAREWMRFYNPQLMAENEDGKSLQNQLDYKKYTKREEFRAWSKQFSQNLSLGLQQQWFRLDDFGTSDTALPANSWKIESDLPPSLTASDYQVMASLCIENMPRQMNWSTNIESDYPGHTRITYTANMTGNQLIIDADPEALASLAESIEDFINNPRLPDSIKFNFPLFGTTINNTHLIIDGEEIFYVEKFSGKWWQRLSGNHRKLTIYDSNQEEIAHKHFDIKSYTGNDTKDGPIDQHNQGVYTQTYQIWDEAVSALYIKKVMPLAEQVIAALIKGDTTAARRFSNLIKKLPVYIGRDKVPAFVEGNEVDIGQKGYADCFEKLIDFAEKKPMNLEAVASTVGKCSVKQDIILSPETLLFLSKLKADPISFYQELSTSSPNQNANTLSLVAAFGHDEFNKAIKDEDFETADQFVELLDDKDLDPFCIDKNTGKRIPYKSTVLFHRLDQDFSKAVKDNDVDKMRRLAEKLEATPFDIGTVYSDIAKFCDLRNQFIEAEKKYDYRKMAQLAEQLDNKDLIAAQKCISKDEPVNFHGRSHQVKAREYSAYVGPMLRIVQRLAGDNAYAQEVISLAMQTNRYSPGMCQRK